MNRIRRMLAVVKEILIPVPDGPSGDPSDDEEVIRELLEDD